MGLRRWLTTMVCLTATGIAVERPHQFASMIARFIAPVNAGQAQPPEAEQQLPHYIPGGHELSFEGDDTTGTAPAATPGPAASTPATGSIENAAAAAIPASAAASPIVQPVPPVIVEQAAANPTETPATTKRALITIEPDPTLPQNTSTPASKPPPVPAKELFGAAKKPALLAARAIGTYARGCLAGAVALPVDGPAWQAMRLSRNRNWGHPNLVKLVERLAVDSQQKDGWPGLLVGDISQPRGGPMLSGHASHQLGLDADVWLTPMPNRKLTNREREDISATSMLDSTDIAVDPKVFTPGHVQLIKRAASYPEVERVLVHPAIKKALCEAAGPDRAWLGKVRPIQGHYYHFHIRIGCPAGSSSVCKPQTPVTGDDGCGKEVQEWLARVTPYKGPPKPRPPGYKPPPPAPPITMAALPQECTAVLESGPDGVTVPAAAKAAVKANALATAKSRARKVHAARN